LEYGNPLVLDFLLNHPDCKITKRDLIGELVGHVAKHPVLFDYMLTSAPVKYRLTRDDIYVTKPPVWILSVGNIRSIITKKLGPTTAEESRLLYMFVFVFNKDMNQVGALFDNLPTLLPLLKRETVQQDYERAINETYCTGDFKERDELRKAYLDRTKTAEETAAEDRKRHEKKEAARRREEEQRKRDEAERQRLALWNQGASSQQDYSLTNKNVNDIFAAFYQIFQAHMDERNRFSIPSGPTVNFTGRDGKVVSGQLVKIEGSMITYEYLGTGAYGYSNYREKYQHITTFEGLRSVMQKVQRQAADSVYTSRQEGLNSIQLTFGDQPSDTYFLTFYLQPADYIDYSALWNKLPETKTDCVSLSKGAFPKDMWLNLLGPVNDFKVNRPQGQPLKVTSFVLYRADDNGQYGNYGLWMPDIQLMPIPKSSVRGIMADLAEKEIGPDSVTWNPTQVELDFKNGNNRYRLVLR
jgi:hypothetical protein